MDRGAPFIRGVAVTPESDAERIARFSFRGGDVGGINGGALAGVAGAAVSLSGGGAKVPQVVVGLAFPVAVIDFVAGIAVAVDVTI